MSEDPKLAAALAVPFIKGVQENDVAACVKHKLTFLHPL